MFCGPDSSSGATSHGLRLRRRRDKPAWEKERRSPTSRRSESTMAPSHASAPREGSGEALTGGVQAGLLRNGSSIWARSRRVSAIRLARRLFSRRRRRRAPSGAYCTEMETLIIYPILAGTASHTHSSSGVLGGARSSTIRSVLARTSSAMDLLASPGTTATTVAVDASVPSRSEKREARRRFDGVGDGAVRVAGELMRGRSLGENARQGCAGGGCEIGRMDTIEFGGPPGRLTGPSSG